VQDKKITNSSWVKWEARVTRTGKGISAYEIKIGKPDENMDDLGSDEMKILTWVLRI
jgi:hypothetical protein